MEMNRRTALGLLGAAGATLAVPRLSSASIESQPITPRSLWEVTSTHLNGTFISHFAGEKRESGTLFYQHVNDIKEGKVPPHYVYRDAPEHTQQYGFEWLETKFGKLHGDDTYEYIFADSRGVPFSIQTVLTVRAERDRLILGYPERKLVETDKTIYRLFYLRGSMREPFYTAQVYGYGSYHHHRFDHPDYRPHRHPCVWHRCEFWPHGRLEGRGIDPMVREAVATRLSMFGGFPTT